MKLTITYPNRCPVCHKMVLPDLDGRVYRHRDGISQPCPASGQPYTITCDDILGMRDAKPIRTVTVPAGVL